MWMRDDGVIFLLEKLINLASSNFHELLCVNPGTKIKAVI
jgi:hypothetical protein